MNYVNRVDRLDVPRFHPEWISKQNAEMLNNEKRMTTKNTPERHAVLRQCRKTNERKEKGKEDKCVIVLVDAAMTVTQ